MTTVDRIKAICKDRKIPISRLERELNFSNGYIRSLKRGTLPDDRLNAVANYLNVSIERLMGKPEAEGKTEKADSESNSAAGLEPLRNDDEKDLIKIYRKVSRKGQHELMANAYDIEKSEELAGDNGGDQADAHRAG